MASIELPFVIGRVESVLTRTHGYNSRFCEAGFKYRNHLCMVAFPPFLKPKQECGQSLLSLRQKPPSLPLKE